MAFCRCSDNDVSASSNAHCTYVRVLGASKRTLLQFMIALTLQDSSCDDEFEAVSIDPLHQYPRSGVIQYHPAGVIFHCQRQAKSALVRACLQEQ